MTEQQLPAGAVPIDINEFFQCIGELYFQVHKLREAVQAGQAGQSASPQNGQVAAGALQLEP